MREEAAVILEGIKAADNLAIELVARKSIGDNFLRLGDDFKNCFPQSLERGSVRLTNLR
jgi:hypothetical protein